MEAKKKPTAKKPTAKKPNPADVHHGRIAEAEAREAETQAVGVENLALAVDNLAAVAAGLVRAFAENPKSGEPSRLERLVVAAEKQADARLRIAAAFEASNLRQQAIHEVELAERKAKSDLVVALLAREKACALELDKPTPVAPVGDAPQPAPASGGRAAYAGDPLGVDMTPIVPVEPTDLGTPPQA